MVVPNGDVQLPKRVDVAVVAVPRPTEAVEELDLAMLTGSPSRLGAVSLDEFGVGDAVDADAVLAPVPLLMRGAVPAGDLHEDVGPGDACNGAGGVPRTAEAHLRLDGDRVARLERG